MSKMHLNVSKMLSDYGTDISVIKPEDQETEKIAGITIPTDPDYSKAQKEKRHEPVLPISSSTSQLANLISGGEAASFDLLWVSNGEYPINTLVEVPSQGGRYRVMGLSNYSDYTSPHVFIYQLKGDSLNGSGKQPAKPQGPIPTGLYSGAVSH